MVRRRVSAVSNHELGVILRDVTQAPLPRMKIGVYSQRDERVQFSPPQSAPMQPSTFKVSGPATETLLA